MQIIDFSKYSLVLIHDEQVVYTSDQPGLRPLLACLAECRNRYRNCVLHDRVTGLAAARLIVHVGLQSDAGDIGPGGAPSYEAGEIPRGPATADASGNKDHVGLIASVVTQVASKPARTFLQQHGIDLSADLMVENILRKDRTAICPAEQIALVTDGPGAFLSKINAMSGNVIPADAPILILK